MAGGGILSGRNTKPRKSNPSLLRAFRVVNCQDINAQIDRTERHGYQNAVRVRSMDIEEH
jgi:hypothetical protein